MDGRKTSWCVWAAQGNLWMISKERNKCFMANRQVEIQYYDWELGGLHLKNQMSRWLWQFPKQLCKQQNKPRWPKLSGNFQFRLIRAVFQTFLLVIQSPKTPRKKTEFFSTILPQKFKLLLLIYKSGNILTFLLWVPDLYLLLETMLLRSMCKRI